MINFLDIKKVNAQYNKELIQVATEVIDSGWYLLGERVKIFEDELATFIGSRHAIGCANGLDALRLILRAYIEMGVMHEGNEILVPANTYIASILAITDNKLIPVLVEPDITTYNIDLSLIEENITPLTRAIMIVHLYGRTCWDVKLNQLAKKYDLKIIEDNAQAIGARYDKIRTGNLGDASGFSFYPGKNLGALGDSGAVTTNDDNLMQVIRAIANYGSSKKYINEYQGLNSRMDEIQAAFLSVKLKHIDIENKKRTEIAKYFCDNIKNPKIILPHFPKEEAHVWHLFVIRAENRDNLQNYLTQNNIQTLIHYPIPPHKQVCYKILGPIKLPITEKIHKEVLSLPISPIMTENETEMIVKTINSY